MADHDPLLVTREGPVVRATMNRPERRNALSTAMGAAWDALLAELAADATARVLVIGGAGGHFCAGLDLTEVASDETPEQKLARQTVRNRRTGQRFADISALPQVVIAAVEGSCHAGGLGFACAADIAVATATARFAAPEVRRGLVPAQILPWLARRAGRTAVTRLVLEAGVIDAAEAARIGLMHQVVVDATALERQVQATIAAVLEGAPRALAETKGLLAALGPIAPEGYAEAGAAAFARTASSAEATEGIAAFKAKRKPNWVG
ncbi:isohexenylglutaconyl-CoA hydratase [Siccirubricoccus deserti]|uniref:Enoyl-CoA hydratase/isomerase family protein n=1 Tax=Siccirubricoccus deserti TaxID=2013562 RepID=A0A9X0R0G9_9PROT|nr:enoyl-CoA hydratase-related protein [Siccirubricoccus deserti]MBC4017326.1 enoyl-CoA hydratase/isomerase family protein [Siccirubricoccus deserti]GGC58803.1 isohexenylglutaconyl-CoA hydratase [Siccirubricoccus deserti]